MVPKDLHHSVVKTNYETFGTQWYAARILHHDHAVPERKMLLLKFKGCVVRLKYSLWWNAFDYRLSDTG